ISLSRKLKARATLRMIQNRPTDALADIETLIALGSVMQKDRQGVMIQYLVATALRNIAVDEARSYFLNFRENGAALADLSKMLARRAPDVHVDFPGDIVSASEPAYGAVVPYFEIAVPNLKYGYDGAYEGWAQFDELTLAFAIDAYHRERG